jgi:hypothetical protein
MLDGYKTYLAGLAAFLTALAVAINDYIAGGVIDYQPVILALVALAIIFLRQGVKKEVVK